MKTPQLLVPLAFFLLAVDASATTKGLSQIVTPDLQEEGDLSLSFQAQSEKIANPYQIQGELGLTKWAEIAVFKGFKPNELIFGTEFGLIQKEPYLLSVGFVNWSPHSHVDPQPYLEAGYYTEHHKFIVGAIHVDYRNEAILGYAYDFNKTWRAQVDFQSGSGNSSTIGFTCNVTRDFQINPALYVTNDSPHDVLGYVVFTYTFHLWGDHEDGAMAFEARRGKAPLLTIFGGDVTTSRLRAERAVSRLTPFYPMSPRWTAKAPLPGGDFAWDGFDDEVDAARERWRFLTEAQAQRLVAAYGSRLAAVLGDAKTGADLGPAFGPELTGAEVRYLMACEWARFPDDILWRRSKLGLTMPPADREALAAFMATAPRTSDARASLLLS